METNEDAERCIKHLNRTVLEGRLVTVEKVSILYLVGLRANQTYLFAASIFFIKRFSSVFSNTLLDKFWQQV